MEREIVTAQNDACERRTRFRFRALNSMFVFFSGTILALSSIALYLAPSCGVARNYGWTFLNLTKDDWTNLHVLVGFAMFIPLVYHVYLNRKSILAYIRRRIGDALEYRLEAGIAFVVAIAIVALIIWFPEQSSILASYGKELAADNLAAQWPQGW